MPARRAKSWKRQDEPRRVVLAALDLFIVSVALPQMARDFGVRDSGLADLLGAERLRDRVRRPARRVRTARRVLSARARLPARVAVFVAGSAACGAATSVAMLVACRVVQAAGAALLTPTALGLILASELMRLLDAPRLRRPRAPQAQRLQTRIRHT
jgi:MFS family permease